MRIRNCSNQALLDLWSIENVAATLFYLRKLDSAIVLKARKDVPLEAIDELTSIKADVLHAGCFRGIVRPSSHRGSAETSSLDRRIGVVLTTIPTQVFWHLSHREKLDRAANSHGWMMLAQNSNKIIFRYMCVSLSCRY